MNVADLLDGKRICICGGSGGVGKTTTSAAIAMGMAARGRKVAVVTIDPARRLANSLGLPEANAAAVKYLNRLGIVADRYTTRMWLGTPPPWRADMIFGVFNFAVA